VLIGRVFTDYLKTAASGDILAEDARELRLAQRN
jgi:hypothetical protein